MVMQARVVSHWRASQKIQTLKTYFSYYHILCCSFIRIGGRDIFFLSLFLATLYLIASGIIDFYWIHEIANVFGNIFAYYIVIFVALIPGFVVIFVLSTIIINKRKNHKEKLENNPSITILIPTYNAAKTVIGTIESILRQEYAGTIHIKVIDDGSADDTVLILKNHVLAASIDNIIVEKHKGKFNALNVGLLDVTTEYVVTLDSDTYLHKQAIQNIVNEIERAKCAAVAGCLFVKNHDETLITKIQQWDYVIGIFGIKLMQSFYQSTLVTQGAFSIYRTDILKELGGWTDNIGEDIILTWQMLKDGYKMSFATNAVAYTDVPKTLKKLGLQRRRWARGMVESFKEVKPLRASKASINTRFLMLLNTFYPFIDLATIIFFPLGITLLLTGSNLLIGPLTLLLIPLGLSLTLTVEIKRRNALKMMEYELSKRSKFAFVLYILFYNIILAPFCLLGYMTEFLNLKKTW